MPTDQWLLLVDPARAPADGQNPPAEAVVGRWLLVDGAVRRFEPDRDYEPATPESATDAVDAALRTEADPAALFAVIRESEFGVALDEHHRPLIAPGPDDMPSLLVTTAPAHRARVRAEAWRVVNAGELAGLLVEHEVDALVNPGASASTRLPTAMVAAPAVHPAG
jgi:hypothetical protein